MTTGDRVWWVHVERASPQVVRHTIVAGRILAVGNSGTAAVVVGGGLSTWFVEASKLVMSLADAQYALRCLQDVPYEPRRSEAGPVAEVELCCVVPENPVPVAGTWTRSPSQCDHLHMRSTATGMECPDCGHSEVFS